MGIPRKASPEYFLIKVRSVGYIFEDLLLGTKTTLFGEKKLISVSCINCCVPITTLYDFFYVLFSQRGCQENELENVKKNKSLVPKYKTKLRYWFNQYRIRFHKGMKNNTDLTTFFSKLHPT